MWICKSAKYCGRRNQLCRKQHLNLLLLNPVRKFSLMNSAWVPVTLSHNDSYLSNESHPCTIIIIQIKNNTYVVVIHFLILGRTGLFFTAKYQKVLITTKQLYTMEILNSLQIKFSFNVIYYWEMNKLFSFIRNSCSYEMKRTFLRNIF